MTGDLFNTVVMGMAALFGALVGRIIASEAEDRATAIFAGAYCGAGAGLMSGPPLAFALALIVKLWRGELGFSGLVEAVETTGPALLWGPAGGAAGGLVLGIIVALFKRRMPRDRGA